MSKLIFVGPSKSIARDADDTHLPTFEIRSNVRIVVLQQLVENRRDLMGTSRRGRLVRAVIERVGLRDGHDNERPLSDNGKHLACYANVSQRTIVLVTGRCARLVKHR